MLKADLNLYPDARFASGTRLGSVLLLRSDAKSYIGFIPAKEYKAATLDIEDPVLQNVLLDIVPFLVRLGSAKHDSESALANTIAHGLPHNLRMTEPRTWPPDKYEELMLSAATEANAIHLFMVAA